MSLAARVLSCCQEVQQILGIHHREAIYQAALAIEFQEQGFSYDTQPSLQVLYKNRPAGIVIPDFLIRQGQEQVALEIKATKGNAGQDQALSQCAKYQGLQSLATIPVLWFNFGRIYKDHSAVKIVLEDTLP